MSEIGKDGNDNPGVVMRPPLLYLTMLALGWGFGLFEPLPLATSGGRAALVGAGAALFVAGVVLAMLCFRRFSSAGTNVPTTLPTKALVTAGPYRFSRNPIYLALTSIYFGIALLLNSGWILILAIPLLVTMRYGVIAREERYLEAKFGDAYRAYKDKVRRWL
jgi:protein-S-isoprenylcysteine O-methyltransferase Ste14